MRARVAVLLLLLVSCSSRPEPAPPSDAVGRILAYIHDGWRVLRRTHADIAAAAEDPKMGARQRWPVYATPSELAAAQATLGATVDPAVLARIELRPLGEAIQEHGLLYLPRPYVVPGGRFNEMYGWDSYFIALGLLRDGEVELARDMVDNFLYSVAHYGTILNANRTYYLTRSQPPFLTRMVLDVYERTRDRAWLAAAVPAMERYYDYWTREPHLTPSTGLSRYHDLGRGPAPEVLASELEEGKTHYQRVAEWLRAHASEVSGYDPARMLDPTTGELTEHFYVADRSMRESGFDPSGRFGPFNAGVLQYDPVCLNTLLWVMERDMAAILLELGRAAEAPAWEARAETRKAAVDRYLWDAERGLYLDYDVERGARRDYPFMTTFFPLWAGMASQQQAEAVIAAGRVFARRGGYVTSLARTGAQWDAPFGWAPLQLVAVEGMRRYGASEEADALAVAFLSLVLAEFQEHNAIFEKYDVEAGESAVSAGIRFGYSSNEIGFGWTNATWLELWADLPESSRARLR
jgi:alpha,alpha-trehalase